MCGKDALEDLTQEVFIKAWKSKKLELKEAKPSTWMYKVAMNVGIDHLRKNKRMMIEFEESTHLQQDSSEVDFLEKESLRQIIQQLDVEHGSVVVLHYFEDLELSEISEVLNLPVGTVKSRLFNARKKLEAVLLKPAADKNEDSHERPKLIKR